LSKEGFSLVCDLVRFESGVTITEVETDGREIVNRGGKIAKRIRNNMRRIHGVKLSDALVQEIGNIANNYTLSAGVYYVEYTQDMEATVGRFGDSNSCFQEGHENYHHLLAMDDDPDFGALRIYSDDPDTARHGSANLARAWTFTDPQDGAMVIWNAYGITLYKITLIASKAFGKPWRKVEISGDVYINNSQVYAIGGEKNRYYFSVDPDSYRNNGPDCYGCGRHIDTDWDWCHQDNDGDYWCQNCFGENFFTCDHCGYHIHNDNSYRHDIHTVGSNTVRLTVCDRCLDRHYHTCVHCKRNYHGEDVVERDGHADRVCHNCIENHAYSICDICERATTWITEIGNMAYCHTCKTDYVCENCDEIDPSTRYYSHMQKRLCCNCYDTLNTCDTETCDQHGHNVKNRGSYLGNLCDDCLTKRLYCTQCNSFCPTGTLKGEYQGLCLDCSNLKETIANKALTPEELIVILSETPPVSPLSTRTIETVPFCERCKDRSRSTMLYRIKHEFRTETKCLCQNCYRSLCWETDSVTLEYENATRYCDDCGRVGANIRTERGRRLCIRCYSDRVNLLTTEPVENVISFTGIEIPF
jgi:hypothetical protein